MDFAGGTKNIRSEWLNSKRIEITQKQNINTGATPVN